MTVEIRRGSTRFVERAAGRSTQHSFSFGEVYDAERLSFGPMLCHDEHILGSGRGFEEHSHTGIEIVSWVTSGSLVHADSSGSSGSPGSSVVVPAGSWAWLSSGAGVRHSEKASADGPCRFVQVWLRALDDAPDEPAYRTGTGPLVVGDSSFLPVRLAAGESYALPVGPRVHAFVASGALLRSSLAEPLSAGDAFELTGEPSYTVTAAVPTDLLVWTLSS